MFGISFFELLIIMALVLIVFGPDKLPEVANSIGKALGQLKRHTDSVNRELRRQFYSPLNSAGRTLDSLSPDNLIGQARESAKKIVSEPTSEDNEEDAQSNRES